MENKRMLRAMLVLFFCFTIHLTSGEAIKTSSISNKTTSGKYEGSRNESVETDKGVTLLCTNEKISWNKMIYVIWKINSQEKNCTISVATNDSDYDTCNDGKKIKKTESGDYNLIIPHFTTRDEGNYICDVSYQSGGYIETIHVTAVVHPELKGWLEKDKSGQTFAICEARSKPAASIYWKALWNTSLPKKNSSKDTSGVFTVTSQLQLPENTSYSDLACMISSGPDHWKEKQFNTFKYMDEKPADSSDKWPFILLGVCATCFIVIVLTGLFIMREKIGQLSMFRKICCTTQIPTPVREEKMPQPRDPEEVEPYASYVQRVNSIYNSSAELFSA